MRTLFLALLIFLAVVAQGQSQFQVLHAFGSGNDGGGVWDSVVFDKQGNLYGTTSGGGDYGYGTVFELTPATSGEWTETILQAFRNGDPNGAEPNGGLVLNAAGNLYGTTQRGGEFDAGVVLELTAGSGGWTETVIHNFGGPGDPACCPWGKLILGRQDNLLGTGDVAFGLSPDSGAWAENVLHNFTGRNGDGLGPQAGPIMDGAGNLYGTTMHGGGGGCGAGCGTVYELLPTTIGTWAPGVTAWRERILYRFGETLGDGAFPGVGQLAIDSRGNVYGTADTGGSGSGGIVFNLTRTGATSSGVWVYAILHNFSQDENGYEPSGGVILDAAGNLYGATINGGSPLCGCGVVYKLAPQPDGTWQYTLLHTFIGSDGAEPDANLTIGPDGNLYGTTATGGSGGGGVVFQIQIAP
jgi:uncharacterized repeat protein (TIGR03803 family)